MKKILFTLAFIFLASFAYAQPSSYTFTYSFEHDGLNTDSYAVSVDGVRVTITPTCIGTGSARTCSGPLLLVLNVTHTIIFYAVGTFGESGSIPFVSDIPKTPVNLKVKK